MSTNKNAYEAGYCHAHGIACHNVPQIGKRISRSVDYVGLGPIVTAENIREYHQILCYAAESNSRCYSPWEHTAAWINSLGDEAEDAWTAYDNGVAAAIADDLAAYTDADYGIDDVEA